MTRRRWAVAVGTLALVLLGWAVVVEPSSLRVREQAVSLQDWPPACNGLRVVVLADLHVGSPFHGLSRLSQIVARVAQLEPDVILLAGDYVIHGVVGGQFVSPEDIALGLRPLSAPMGVWAVLGNHDWWLDAPRMARALTNAGITVLEDAAAPVAASGCRVWLAGISDYWEGAHDIGRALGAVSDEAPIVAFTHNPDLFPEVPPRVSLTVAGHTHGGQVAFPIVGPPIVPSQFGARYASGLVVEDERQLFVSPGLGTSILPVRFLVPPEISVLTLQAR